MLKTGNLFDHINVNNRKKKCKKENNTIYSWSPPKSKEFEKSFPKNTIKKEIEKNRDAMRRKKERIARNINETVLDKDIKWHKTSY